MRPDEFVQVADPTSSVGQRGEDFMDRAKYLRVS